jgi:type II secretory pathway pseudopilin PulG
MSPMRGLRGFAYIEVMVALVLVVSALIPALEALQIGVRGQAVLAGSAVSRDAALRAKMEEVLAKPFETLYAETYLAGGNTASSVSAALSDAAGEPRRVVTIYRTHGSTPSTADTGLVRVRVAYEAGGGAALETLRSKWW